MAPPGGLRVAKPFAERVQSGKGKLIRGALALLLNWLVIAWWMHYRHHSMEAQRPVDVHKAPPPRLLNPNLQGLPFCRKAWT